MPTVTHITCVRLLRPYRLADMLNGERDGVTKALVANGDAELVKQ